MKIIKYKKISGSKYEVELEDGNKIKLYEDIILKEGLLLKKEIMDLDELLNKNQEYAIIDVSLRYLAHHVTSIKGMQEYLLNKGYAPLIVENNIDWLKKQGYLNDDNYAKCYIHDHVNLSNDGPFKIIKHLETMEIPYTVYSSYLDYPASFWQERIKNYLNKQLKVNKKSNYYFKSKMLMNLLNLGYEREMINEELGHIEVANLAELKEIEKAKIRKKLARKYTGEELERKIKEKLFQKGFYEL